MSKGEEFKSGLKETLQYSCSGTSERRGVSDMYICEDGDDVPFFH